MKCCNKVFHCSKCHNHETDHLFHLKNAKLICKHCYFMQNLTNRCVDCNSYFNQNFNNYCVLCAKKLHVNMSLDVYVTKLSKQVSYVDDVLMNRPSDVVICDNYEYKCGHTIHKKCMAKYNVKSVCPICSADLVDSK